MSLKRLFSLWLTLLGCACSASPFYVRHVLPLEESYKSVTQVFIFGRGFTLFGHYYIELVGERSRKTVSCVGYSTELLYCRSPSLHGIFTAEEVGYYKIIIDGVYTYRQLLYIHDESAGISNFGSADKALNRNDTYSVAGGRLLELIISGNIDLDIVVTVAFQSVGLIDGESFFTPVNGKTTLNDDGDTVIYVKTPAWKTPNDWLDSCGDPVVPDGDCAPTLQVDMSLNDRFATAMRTRIKFGYSKPKFLAFIYPGSKDSFGVTRELNKGRAKSEYEFGSLVDDTNVTENVKEGELFLEKTTASNSTAVGSSPRIVLATKTMNSAYTAFQLMKELCQRNFSLVFTCSIGYQKQTLDASVLPECLSSGTKFVNIGGSYTTPTVSVGFVRAFEMRYLTGLAAGADLKNRKLQYEKIYGVGSYGRACVGYIAPFPIAQIQRGINAFVIGCKENFPECVVKVLWTGRFSDEPVEVDAAAFLYNVGQCDILTQHSSFIEPLRYFTDRGGTVFGYNIDARSILGDNVHTSSLVSWDVVFNHYIFMSLAQTWVSQEDFLPGYEDRAVDLAQFSPKMDPATRQQIKAKKIAPIHERIFCGPLMAKYVYKQRAGNGTVFNKPGRPEWEELEVPRQINPQHYITPRNTFLSSSDTPDTTDCLWGTSLHKPWEALKGDAYPDPFDPDRVFNNYLLEGVELFEPVATDFGSVVGTEAKATREGYPSGDRFFHRPVELPLCDGSQWKRIRADCDPATLTTPIIYTFVLDEKYRTVWCGTEVNNNTGKVSAVAELPFISATDKKSPRCDFMPVESSWGMLNTALIISGALFMIFVYVMYWIYRNERTVANTQPALVRAMAASGLWLCVSFALFIGKPSHQTCVVQIWMLNLSFDLMFAMLWAKVYRLYAILKYARKFKKVAITTKEILLLAMNMTLLDAGILIAWTLIDPPTVRSTELNLQIVPGLQSINALECRSESSSFLYVMLFYKFLLISSNCILVYLLRKAPKRLENLIPYGFILISAYNTALFVGIVVFLSNVVTDVVTKHTIYIVGGVTGTMIFIGALACPPLITGMKKREFLRSANSNGRKGINSARRMNGSMSFSDEGFQSPSSFSTQTMSSNSKTENEIMINKL